MCMFNQARAAQGAAIFYALARARTKSLETPEAWRKYFRTAPEYREYHRAVAKLYEYAATCVVPGLAFYLTEADPQERTLEGLGLATVHVGHQRPRRQHNMDTLDDEELR
jgi:hypothetical protein